MIVPRKKGLLEIGKAFLFQMPFRERASRIFLLSIAAIQLRPGDLPSVRSCDIVRNITTLE